MQMNDQETMKNSVVVLLFHIPKYIYIYIRRGLDGHDHIWTIKISLGRRVLYNCTGNIKLNGKFVDLPDFLISKSAAIVSNVCLS